MMEWIKWAIECGMDAEAWSDDEIVEYAIGEIEACNDMGIPYPVSAEAVVWAMDAQ